jgi:hypothetical protein
MLTVQIGSPRAVDVHLGRAGRAAEIFHPPGREREGLEQRRLGHGAPREPLVSTRRPD